MGARPKEPKEASSSPSMDGVAGHPILLPSLMGEEPIYDGRSVVRGGEGGRPSMGGDNDNKYVNVKLYSPSKAA